MSNYLKSSQISAKAGPKQHSLSMCTLWSLCNKHSGIYRLLIPRKSLFSLVEIALNVTFKILLFVKIFTKLYRPKITKWNYVCKINSQCIILLKHPPFSFEITFGTLRSFYENIRTWIRTCVVLGIVTPQRSDQWPIQHWD